MIRPVWCVISLLLGAGCVPSNVVAVRDRSVVTTLDFVEWKPASAADFEGLFVSEQIDGSAAEALWHVEYFFTSNGEFTAAALVATGGMPSFHVQSGTWTFADGRLILGEGKEPAMAETGENGLLRLRGPGGSLVLRHWDLR